MRRKILTSTVILFITLCYCECASISQILTASNESSSSSSLDYDDVYAFIATSESAIIPDKPNGIEDIPDPEVLSKREIQSERQRKRCDLCKSTPRCKTHGKCDQCKTICRERDEDIQDSQHEEKSSALRASEKIICDTCMNSPRCKKHKKCDLCQKYCEGMQPAVESVSEVTSEQPPNHEEKIHVEEDTDGTKIERVENVLDNKGNGHVVQEQKRDVHEEEAQQDAEDFNNNGLVEDERDGEVPTINSRLSSEGDVASPREFEENIVGAGAPNMVLQQDEMTSPGDVDGLTEEAIRYYTTGAVNPGPKLVALGRLLNIHNVDNIEKFVVLAKTKSIHPRNEVGPPTIIDISKLFGNNPRVLTVHGNVINGADMELTTRLDREIDLALQKKKALRGESFLTSDEVAKIIDHTMELYYEMKDREITSDRVGKPRSSEEDSAEDGQPIHTIGTDSTTEKPNTDQTNHDEETSSSQPTQSLESEKTPGARKFPITNDNAVKKIYKHNFGKSGEVFDEVPFEPPVTVSNVQVGSRNLVDKFRTIIEDDLSGGSDISPSNKEEVDDSVTKLVESNIRTAPESRSQIEESRIIEGNKELLKNIESIIEGVNDKDIVGTELKMRSKTENDSNFFRANEQGIQGTNATSKMRPPLVKNVKVQVPTTETTSSSKHPLVANLRGEQQNTKPTDAQPKMSPERRPPLLNTYSEDDLNRPPQKPKITLKAEEFEEIVSTTTTTVQAPTVVPSNGSQDSGTTTPPSMTEAEQITNEEPVTEAEQQPIPEADLRRSGDEDVIVEEQKSRFGDLMRQASRSQLNKKFNAHDFKDRHEVFQFGPSKSEDTVRGTKNDERFVVQSAQESTDFTADPNEQRIPEENNESFSDIVDSVEELLETKQNPQVMEIRDVVQPADDVHRTAAPFNTVMEEQSATFRGSIQSTQSKKNSDRKPKQYTTIIPIGSNERVMQEQVGAKPDWAFREKPTPSSKNFHFGSIIPSKEDSSIIHHKQKHPSTNKAYFVADSVKLPLQMEHAEDGSVHLALDTDKICNCKETQCPARPDPRQSSAAQEFGNAEGGEAEIKHVDSDAAMTHEEFADRFKNKSQPESNQEFGIGDDPPGEQLNGEEFTPTRSELQGEPEQMENVRAKRSFKNSNFDTYESRNDIQYTESDVSKNSDEYKYNDTKKLLFLNEDTAVNKRTGILTDFLTWMKKIAMDINKK